jgi:sugar (pentulose or hexulose) kinase
VTGSTTTIIGVDLGTTSSKALVRDLDGREVALVEARTPWSTADGDRTQTSAIALLQLTTDLLRRAVAQAERQVGRVQVAGVGVAGLAESGVLLDRAGRPCAPVIAWFDRRGAEQVDRLDRRAPDLSREFSRRTGLPWDCQASLAKLMWLQDDGLHLTARHRWASVPEFVVHRLGADLVREPSLASRTGLVDQDTGLTWDEGAAIAGLPTTLLPPALPGGQSAGLLRSPDLPSSLQGAHLTVAGHDHPVAAIGVGAVGADELFNSTGTADVLARSLPGRLSADQRELLVQSGLSAGAHVLTGTTLVLGGVRGGLLLRRVLGLLGGTDPQVREALDAAALACGELPQGLEVSGAGRTGDDVVLRMRDDATPAAVWAAATRYTARQTREVLENMERVVGPHTRAVACGGWTRMRSVRAAKSSAVHHLTFSPLAEPGVVGAALLAERAATASARPPEPLPSVPTAL